MNRDWHSAPLQGGGRDVYDYGRTTLEPQETWVERWAWPLLGLALILFWLGFGLVLENLLP